ncbi:hypothetical protein FQN57_000188 [Myotisia sp. PD_48]|nr:hypothetical protein FQN57_000188 [Myotisia sp. PD_48]
MQEKPKQKLANLAADDISREYVRILAHILYLDIHNNPKDQEVARFLMANLPACLRRSRIRSLVTDKLGLLAATTTTPNASCALHKPLNRLLIRSLFQLIHAEVGDRLDFFVTSQSKLSTEQRRMVQSLRSVNALWMTKVAFERTYLFPASDLWKYQADGCEACMINQIVRNPEVLTNLRTVLLSRLGRLSSHPVPRLMRWVEEFVSFHGPLGWEVCMRSGEDSLALQQVRKQIKAAANRRYRPKLVGIMPNIGVYGRRFEEGSSLPCVAVVSPRCDKSALPTPPTDEVLNVEKVIEADLENDIIDCYMDQSVAEDRVSFPTFSSSPSTSTSSAPTSSCKEIRYNEPTSHVAVILNQPEPQPQGQQAVYSNSTDTGESLHSPTPTISVEFAIEYQKLLGIDLGYAPDATWKYAAPFRQTTPASMAMTNWSILDSRMSRDSVETIPPLKIRKLQKKNRSSSKYSVPN